MAKKFNDIYKESKAKVYSKAVNALVIASKGVPGIIFDPMLSPNGKVDDTTSKYTIQRRKRPSVNTVVDPNTGSTKASLDSLDQFSKPEYDALEVATGILRSVGFRGTFNDDYDYSNSPAHKRDMEYQVGEVAAQRHKDILAELAKATPSGTTLPAYTKGDTLVWDAISDEVIRLAAKDDEFMDVQDISDFYIVTSRKVAKELAKEMGTAFNQEASIAQSGFTSSMSVNGTPVIVDARLTGREVYVAHNQAIAFGKQEVFTRTVNLGLSDYYGAFFYDILVTVDKARVSKIATTK